MQDGGSAWESNPPCRCSRRASSVLKTEAGTSPARASVGEITPNEAHYNRSACQSHGVGCTIMIERRATHLTDADLHRLRAALSKKRTELIAAQHATTGEQRGIHDAETDQ